MTQYHPTTFGQAILKKCFISVEPITFQSLSQQIDNLEDRQAAISSTPVGAAVLALDQSQGLVPRCKNSTPSC